MPALSKPPRLRRAVLNQGLGDQGLGGTRRDSEPDTRARTPRRAPDGNRGRGSVPVPDSSGTGTGERPRFWTNPSRGRGLLSHS
jgi:hypothetical protein